MRLRRLALWASGLALAGILLLTGTAFKTSHDARRTARAHAESGVTASALPPRWVEWFLTVEDPSFYVHSGIDLKTPGAGWTTLTQSLVKSHFAGPKKGLVGKPLQSYRALVLNAVMTKDEQLTLILNTAYFGRGDHGAVLGFPAAARAIYGIPLEELSDREFLGLVAMLVGPNQFHPLRRPEAHAERVRRLETLLAGRCAPADWRDVYLEACAAS